jgi:hypothetical protein
LKLADRTGLSLFADEQQQLWEAVRWWLQQPDADSLKFGHLIVSFMYKVALKRCVNRLLSSFLSFFRFFFVLHMSLELINTNSNVFFFKKNFVGNSNVPLNGVFVFSVFKLLRDNMRAELPQFNITSSDQSIDQSPQEGDLPTVNVS